MWENKLEKFYDHRLKTCSTLQTIKSRNILCIQIKGYVLWEMFFGIIINVKLLNDILSACYKNLLIRNLFVCFLIIHISYIESK